jgi:hypothetical protein
MTTLNDVLSRFARAGDDLESALGLNDDSTAADILAVAEWLESDDAADAIDSEGAWALTLRDAGLATDLRELADSLSKSAARALAEMLTDAAMADADGY